MFALARDFIAGNKAKLLAKDFLANRRGNFGILFAAVAVPVMIAVSFALNSSTASSTRFSLQDAADAAALAVAAAPSTASDIELQTLAQSFFYAHKASVIQKRGTDRTLTEQSVIAQVAASEIVTDRFAFLGNKEPLTVSVVAKASLATRTPEIALVIDNTVDFNAGLVWDDVVKEFDTLLTGLQDTSASDKFRVSLVPFVDRVNPGRERAINWIVEDALVDLLNGKVSREKIRVLIQSKIGQKLISKLPFLKDWNGCLEPREKKGKKFSFVLDKNRPLKDFFNPTATKYKKGITAIDGATTCPTEVLPQAEDLKEIISALETMPMGVAGEGRYDEGLAWGWRTLTPDWQGDWGQTNFPADAGSTRKIVVMLTDGLTGSHVYDFGGLGRTWPLGVNNGHPIQFEHMVDLCERIKEDDIEIALFHVIGNEAATPYFKECASPDLYFEVRSAKDIDTSADALVQSNAGTARLVN